MSTTTVSFRRSGRALLPAIDHAEDLAALPALEDARWFATAVTVDSLDADGVFLRHLDRDGDGRIRSDDVREAISWLFAHLSLTGGVTQGAEQLLLAAIRSEAPEGKTLLAAAQRVLTLSGSPTNPEVTLAVVRQVRAQREAEGLAVAGKLLPAAAGADAALVDLLVRVAEITGGEPYPGGGVAVSAAQLAQYRAEAEAWLHWRKGAADFDDVEGLAEVAAAFQAAEAPLAAFFLLCDTLALNPALADKPWITGANSLQEAAAQLGASPIASPNPEGLLDLKKAINPVYRHTVLRLVNAAGLRSPLSRLTLEALRESLAPFLAWQAAAPNTKISCSNADSLRATLDDLPRWYAAETLLAATHRVADELAGLVVLEKLLLFQANILRFAASMASGAALLDARFAHMAEQGTLILDGRRFHLAIRATDLARAEKFASRSPIFLLFVQVGPKGGAPTREVMVPLTAGERGSLVEGQWGVFLRPSGEHEHAFVRKIATNPISVREAVFAPFRKFSDALQALADKAAGEQTTAMDKRVGGAAEKTLASAQLPKEADAEPVADAPAAPPKAGVSGQLPMLLAGGGLALAALSSAAAYAVEVIWGGAAQLAQGVVALPFWADLPGWVGPVVQVLSLPLAIIAIVTGLLLLPFLAYALPVGLATWLRLRRRDLATLLEGAGWAVNTRLPLDEITAAKLTSTPSLASTTLKLR